MKRWLLWVCVAAWVACLTLPGSAWPECLDQAKGYQGKGPASSLDTVLPSEACSMPAKAQEGHPWHSERSITVRGLDKDTRPPSPSVFAVHTPAAVAYHCLWNNTREIVENCTCACPSIRFSWHDHGTHTVDCRCTCLTMAMTTLT